MNRVLTVLVLCIATVMAVPGFAAAPERSLRPLSRPQQNAAARPDAMIILTRAPGVQISRRPLPRPQLQVQATRRVAPTGLILPQPVQTPVVAQGSICAIPSIKGRKLPRIPGKLKGCGIRSPVQVTSVSGVSLSPPATMNCTTAKALDTWVKNGVKPIIGRLGGGAASLQVIADYSCRTRNSRPGAKISEHAKGNALDISAINLKDGTSLTVLDGWKKRADRRRLKRLHSAACGPFGTVLGPDADRFHRNHFHLDTAQYRGGSYCR